jgi:glycogen phosphorylase
MDQPWSAAQPTTSVESSEGSLLWTLEEIARLVSQRGDPAETLTNVVHLIQQRFQTDVCSVYLLETDRANLVLAATIGLRPDSVGRVRMRITEGLAGLVAQRLQPQIVADATAHPRFKYFPEAGEDPYRSFLGVPLIENGLLQGVLVVQTIEARTFSADAVRMLVMAGTQLATIVSEVRTRGFIAAPSHQRLLALAKNLWWSWDDDTTRLFQELDHPLPWRECDSNPIAMLQQIPLDALDGRASFSRAITSRVRPIWVSRWSPWACITTRAISVSGSIGTAGSTRTT